jgi:serine/threonine-protein kinase
MKLLSKGDTVRFYEIIDLVDEGQGGMSAVYKARLRSGYRSPEYPDVVALKVALSEYEDRLRAEADYLSRFSHPNVVKVFRVPKTHRPAYVGSAKLDDRSVVFYMAMECLNGGSLSQQLERRRRLGLQEAIGLARDVALALQHSHSQQIVNLDVKPDNILFRNRGHRWLRRYPTAVLCDFGIARDLRYPKFGEYAATIPYAAPEQLFFGRSDPARLGYHSDIFQWGVVVYQAVTGELPFGFDATGLVDLQRAAVSMNQFRRVPKSLDTLVLQTLNKDPSRRPQNMQQVLYYLDQLDQAPPESTANGDSP